MTKDPVRRVRRAIPSPKETQMQPFEKTVTTAKSFDAAVTAVEQKAVENGFRVLHTHDVAATLAEKGFPRPPLKIVEVCNAKYASQILNKDIRIALMLPCPITVFVEQDQVRISTFLPTTISQFFPDAGVAGIAAEVEAFVLKIIDEAR
jgi:uncharacterized protein (DUF302 family)